MFDQPRKFLIDEMLGKLSRWLRMLGYDTAFAKDYEIGLNHSVSDKNLIQICLKEKRTLISRDKELILRYKSNFRRYFKQNILEDSKIPCLFIKTQILTDQIKFIHKKFKINLTYDINSSRCPKCNFKIKQILDTLNYQNLIPVSVFAYHDEFWQCTNEKCEKIYWKGTHIDKINYKLEIIRKEINVDPTF